MKNTLTVLAALICGCSPGDHTTTTPITGAFGYRLGDKLPAAMEIKHGHFWYDESNTTTPPFFMVQGSCLTDRTILEITGAAEGSHSSEVVAALEQKYGPGDFSYTTNAETYTWKNGCNQLECCTVERSVIVTYKNTDLNRRLGDEYQNADKASGAALAPHL